VIGIGASEGSEPAHDDERDYRGNYFVRPSGCNGDSLCEKLQRFAEERTFR
jgi:hypothetical protein